MKKFILAIVCLFSTISFANAQYVVPNFTNTPPPSNSTSRTTEGTRLPNISVNFYQHGNWTFKFYSDGTFSKHIFTANNYYRIIEDKGQKGGTYSIYENEDGWKFVYLRYTDGRTERGYLTYYSNYIEFHINSKVHRDNWY